MPWIPHLRQQLNEIILWNLIINVIPSVTQFDKKEESGNFKQRIKGAYCHWYGTLYSPGHVTSAQIYSPNFALLLLCIKKFLRF